MPRKKKPGYSNHKPSGQAYVRIDGKDHYLVSYDSPESRAAVTRSSGNGLRADPSIALL